MRAVAITFLLLASGCAHLYAHPLPTEARHHRAKTADGWELALVQYVPEGTPTGRPVLLCHGISANGRHMDLDETHSLARWFVSQGREAWILSIRGTGLSDRADRRAGRAPGYSFDTVWQQDFSAAIDYVRTHAQAWPAHLRGTNADIDYVGHSMGGMLIYAYLSQGGEGVNAAVTLGSPTRLDGGGDLQPRVIAATRTVIAPDGVIPMENGALVSMAWQGRTEDSLFERLLYNPANTTPESWRRLVAIGTADISGALWLQFGRWVETGAFDSADGKIDYRRDMSRIRTPVLVVSGKVDRIAPPPAVKDGYRALGGPKRFLLMAEENGVQADYGHMDYLLGERASTELWPHLLDFLAEHDLHVRTVHVPEGV